MWRGALIPTTTGSAKAIVEIFPELENRINGHAVSCTTSERVSDWHHLWSEKQDTTAEEVNAMLKEASENELKGILGFEERPLVSIDYKGDPTFYYRWRTVYHVGW